MTMRSHDRAVSDRLPARDRYAGRRVLVQCAAGWHRGTVTVFDTSTQRHLVGFDNGDVKWQVSAATRIIFGFLASLGLARLEACTHRCTRLRMLCAQVLR